MILKIQELQLEDFEVYLLIEKCLFLSRLADRESCPFEACAIML